MFSVTGGVVLLPPTIPIVLGFVVEICFWSSRGSLRFDGLRVVRSSSELSVVLRSSGASWVAKLSRVSDFGCTVSIPGGGFNFGDSGFACICSG